MIRLMYPWALALLAILPLLWWLWLRPARRSAIRFSTLRLVEASGGTRRGRLHLLAPLLRTAALVCLIVAAARPQKSDTSSQIYVEGIAIQLVLDTSSSMNDPDLSPPGQRMTRFEVVQDVIRRFVAGDGELPGRPNDLVGIVRFARFADSVCPLTLDRAAVLEVVGQMRTVTPRSPEDQTAIGDGLALAVERLRQVQRTTGGGQQLTIHSRVIILLTDGENNAGMIPPRTAGELAATYGIRVYTILAGTGQNLGFGRRLPVDDADLRFIADVSGGRFYRAGDRDALRDVYAEIDRLERTRTEERRHVRWGELALPWLGAALALLTGQALLEATWLRKIP